MKWKIVLFFSLLSLISFVFVFYMYNLRMELCGYFYGDYSHLTFIFIGNFGGILSMYLAFLFYFRSWEGTDVPENVKKSIGNRK